MHIDNKVGRSWRTWQVAVFAAIALVIGFGVATSRGAGDRSARATADAKVAAASQANKALAAKANADLAARDAAVSQLDQLRAASSTTRAVPISPTPTAAPGTTIPTPTIPPTTAPSSTTRLGSRASPLPRGAEAAFTNGWAVKVNDVTPDATAAVRARNQFNDPPPAGQQFYIVNITAAYSGPGSKTPLSDLRFSTVDSGNTQITEGHCGVIPDDFDAFKEVFSGGSLTGNICFAVPSATFASLVLYVDAGLFQTQRAFFALI